jgi:hypothetical protein
MTNKDNDKKDELSQEEMQRLNEYFPITKPQIDEIFLAYEQRKYDEELLKVQELGGESAIISKLRTNTESGISNKNEKDLDNRVKYFDSNAREVEEVPHCCWFVWEAFGDLMIRILVVAAIVQTALGASPLAHDPSRDWVDGMSIIIAVVLVVMG